MNFKNELHGRKNAKDEIRNLGGIERHNQRTFENHSNPDIDPEKQDLNYDLVNDEPINYKEKYKKL